MHVVGILKRCCYLCYNFVRLAQYQAHGFHPNVTPCALPLFLSQQTVTDMLNSLEADLMSIFKSGYHNQLEAQDHYKSADSVGLSDTDGTSEWVLEKTHAALADLRRPPPPSGSGAESHSDSMSSHIRERRESRQTMSSRANTNRNSASSSLSGTGWGGSLRSIVLPSPSASDHYESTTSLAPTGSAKPPKKKAQSKRGGKYKESKDTMIPRDPSFASASDHQPQGETSGTQPSAKVGESNSSSGILDVLLFRSRKVN